MKNRSLNMLIVAIALLIGISIAMMVMIAKAHEVFEDGITDRKSVV